MEEPTAWAKSAIEKKGEPFTLTAEGKEIKTELIVADEVDIGGGYEAFHFTFEGPESEDAPTFDGLFVVSQEGAPETELFLVFNAGTDTNDLWSAQITAKA